ncbi:hypothetical protein A0H81_04951 [Grifola frondosa]|uniref:DNA-binding protein RAP1 n=1 Tax=Grifola frondosa TaxID=5627 RepID=A0A1C7MHH7_GRIFR|nr:hypothetical protein A0H81_04951 [Grifola frondosa]
MSPCGRVPFSNKDDHFLAMYIAKYNPDTKGRNGNGIYKRLVENAEGKWPWARHHPWQSWRERYIKENLFIDKLVRKYIRENGGDLPDAHASTSQPSHHVKTSQSSRTEFSHEDDEHLIKYIARYNPLLSGRSGNVLYQTLEANTEQKWAWSTRHPWKSWRERYVNKKEYFDMRILKYQEEKGVRSYLDKDEVKGKEKHGDSDENEETPTAKSSGRPQQEKRKRPSTEEDVESRKGKRRRVGDPVPGKGHKVVEILSDEAGDDTRGSTKESHQGGRQDNGKEDTTHDAGRHISRGNKDDVIEHTGGDAIGRDGAQTKKPRPGPTVVDQEEDGEVRLPEEQEADELLEEASMDSSERDAMQVVEEVTPKKNEDITPLSYSPSPSLTPPIPNHADIDIRLPSSVAAGKPTPPTYPASSTGTRLQGRPSPLKLFHLPVLRRLRYHLHRQKQI